MQLVNMIQPRGAATISTMTNFTPQHLENFWVKMLNLFFASIAKSNI